MLLYYKRRCLFVFNTVVTIPKANFRLEAGFYTTPESAFRVTVSKVVFTFTNTTDNDLVPFSNQSNIVASRFQVHTSNPGFQPKQLNMQSFG